MNKFRLAALGIAALLVAALLLPAVTPNLAAQEGVDGESTRQRTISTSGVGRVSVQPDFGVVTLGVTTEAEEAAAAMTDNSTTMQAVVDALQEAGIPAEDIQTQVVRLQPRYEQPQPPQQAMGELIGYEATNLVEVRVEDLSLVGSVIDAAVQAGANRVDNIGFDVDDQSDVFDQAREAAWQDALSKAQQLADLAGVELGTVMTISESSGPIIPFADVARGGEGAVPIQPGTETVEVSVHVTWLLEGGDGAAAGTNGATAQATAEETAQATAEATAQPMADEVTIELLAENNAFDMDTITVPAGAHVVVEFTNEDAVPHNLAVYTSEDAEEEIFAGQTITGPGETITYEFDAPEEAGTYFFRCDVHPTMNGDFIVE